MLDAQYSELKALEPSLKWSHELSNDLFRSPLHSSMVELSLDDNTMAATLQSAPSATANENNCVGIGGEDEHYPTEEDMLEERDIHWDLVTPEERQSLNRSHSHSNSNGYRRRSLSAVLTMSVSGSGSQSRTSEGQEEQEVVVLNTPTKSCYTPIFTSPVLPEGASRTGKSGSGSRSKRSSRHHRNSTPSTISSVASSVASSSSSTTTLDASEALMQSPSRQSIAMLPQPMATTTPVSLAKQPRSRSRSHSSRSSTNRSHSSRLSIGESERLSLLHSHSHSYSYSRSHSRLVIVNKCDQATSTEDLILTVDSQISPIILEIQQTFVPNLDESLANEECKRLLEMTDRIDEEEEEEMLEEEEDEEEETEESSADEEVDVKQEALQLSEKVHVELVHTADEPQLQECASAKVFDESFVNTLVDPEVLEEDQDHSLSTSIHDVADQNEANMNVVEETARDEESTEGEEDMEESDCSECSGNTVVKADRSRITATNASNRSVVLDNVEPEQAPVAEGEVMEEGEESSMFSEQGCHDMLHLYDDHRCSTERNNEDSSLRGSQEQTVVVAIQQPPQDMSLSRLGLGMSMSMSLDFSHIEELQEMLNDLVGEDGQKLNDDLVPSNEEEDIDDNGIKQDEENVVEGAIVTPLQENSIEASSSSIVGTVSMTPLPSSRSHSQSFSHQPTPSIFALSTMSPLNHVASSSSSTPSVVPGTSAASNSLSTSQVMHQIDEIIEMLHEISNTTTPLQPITSSVAKITGTLIVASLPAVEEDHANMLVVAGPLSPLAVAPMFVEENANKDASGIQANSIQSEEQQVIRTPASLKQKQTPCDETNALSSTPGNSNSDNVKMSSSPEIDAKTLFHGLTFAESPTSSTQVTPSLTPNVTETVSGSKVAKKSRSSLKSPLATSSACTATTSGRKSLSALTPSQSSKLSQELPVALRPLSPSPQRVQFFQSTRSSSLTIGSSSSSQSEGEEGQAKIKSNTSSAEKEKRMKRRSKISTVEATSSTTTPTSEKNITKTPEATSSSVKKGQSPMVPSSSSSSSRRKSTGSSNLPVATATATKSTTSSPLPEAASTRPALLVRQHSANAVIASSKINNSLSPKRSATESLASGSIKDKTVSFPSSANKLVTSASPVPLSSEDSENTVPTSINVNVQVSENKDVLKLPEKLIPSSPAPSNSNSVKRLHEVLSPASTNSRVSSPLSPAATRRNDVQVYRMEVESFTDNAAPSMLQDVEDTIFEKTGLNDLKSASAAVVTAASSSPSLMNSKTKKQSMQQLLVPQPPPSSASKKSHYRVPFVFADTSLEYNLYNAKSFALFKDSSPSSSTKDSINNDVALDSSLIVPYEDVEEETSKAVSSPVTENLVPISETIIDKVMEAVENQGNNNAWSLADSFALSESSAVNHSPQEEQQEVDHTLMKAADAMGNTSAATTSSSSTNYFPNSPSAVFSTSFDTSALCLVVEDDSRLAVSFDHDQSLLPMNISTSPSTFSLHRVACASESASVSESDSSDTMIERPCEREQRMEGIAFVNEFSDLEEEEEEHQEDSSASSIIESEGMSSSSFSFGHSLSPLDESTSSNATTTMDVSSVSMDTTFVPIRIKKEQRHQERVHKKRIRSTSRVIKKIIVRFAFVCIIVASSLSMIWESLLSETVKERLLVAKELSVDANSVVDRVSLLMMLAVGHPMELPSASPPSHETESTFLQTVFDDERQLFLYQTTTDPSLAGLNDEHEVDMYSSRFVLRSAADSKRVVSSLLSFPRFAIVIGDAFSDSSTQSIAMMSGDSSSKIPFSRLLLPTVEGHEEQQLHSVSVLPSTSMKTLKDGLQGALQKFKNKKVVNTVTKQVLMKLKRIKGFSNKLFSKWK